MPLDERRRAILAILVENRGQLPGAGLSGGQKRSATEMERDGLVAWIPAASTLSASRNHQTLRLIKAGLLAFQADKASKAA